MRKYTDIEKKIIESMLIASESGNITVLRCIVILTNYMNAEATAWIESTKEAIIFFKKTPQFEMQLLFDVENFKNFINDLEESRLISIAKLDETEIGSSFLFGSKGESFGKREAIEFFSKMPGFRTHLPSVANLFSGELALKFIIPTPALFELKSNDYKSRAEKEFETNIQIEREHFQTSTANEQERHRKQMYWTIASSIIAFLALIISALSELLQSGNN